MHRINSFDGNRADITSAQITKSLLMKLCMSILFLISNFCFGQKTGAGLSTPVLNKIANDYVRLGLSIGQYDADFVDAYYGPDSLKPTGTKKASFPRDSFLQAVENLKRQLQPFLNKAKDASLNNRAKWINSQLTAFGRRIKMFAGEQSSFEVQVKELFGVSPPSLDEEHFKSLLKRLENILPGKGSVVDRFQALANRFVIPREKLDTVIKATIAESKKRTQQYLQLPATEDFKMEYVTGKSWSGYNWYQGDFKSLLQFNTDITSFVDRILDAASHEGYPGHHVYNSLLEKNLYRDKGWAEISLYPLFSPQSLIAEGSANYGIEVAFPKQEKLAFIKKQLLPLAGLDHEGLETYFQALAIKGKLSHVRTEVCRRLINGKMTDVEAARWLMEYGLFNEKDAARALSFIKKYQSYVINYTYGMDLVRNYIETRGGTENNPSKRWSLFKWLLSNEVVPASLSKK